jgi:beta-barrel assembly-enhancing protease
MTPVATHGPDLSWESSHRNSRSSLFVATFLQFLLLLVAVIPLPCQGQTSLPDQPPELVFPESPAPLPPTTIVLPSLAPPPVPRNIRPFPEKYRLDRIGHRNIGNGFNLISLKSDSDIGQQFARELDATIHFSSDTVVTEFVNRIGQNVARHSDGQGPFAIKVVDSDEVNAFSLPGGYVYVNSGLLNFTESEAEVAGVMAHEVAHVAARHASRTLSRGALISTLFQIGGAALGRRTGAGIAASLSGAFVTPLLMMKFSRSFENEADLLALQYMYDAGYDPGAYIQFLEKVRHAEPAKPRALTRLFSTHPPTEERIKKCQQFLNEYFPDRESYLVTTSAFDEIRVRVANPAQPHIVDEADEKGPVLRRRTPHE